MINILAGIFFILHGLVHLLYFGHTARYFELKKGLSWPDGSLILSKITEKEKVRPVAGTALVISAVAFIIGAIALFVSLGWWQIIILSAAALSTALYILCWDGRMKALPDKGLFAIIINVAIIVLITVFDIPAL
jgi:hypothetical protein